jgi:hypothetical protein
MYYIPQKADAVELKGNTALFTKSMKSKVQNAAEGCKYVFTDINLQCGTEVPKKVNDLTFSIR